MVSLPFMGNCQLLTDADASVELAIKKMALNYRDMGVKKYTVEYREKYGSQRTRHEKFKYEYINDSTLFHRHRLYGEIFILRDNSFIQGLPKQDTTGNYQYFKENKWEVFDSAGVTYTYRYSQLDGDTVLQSIHSIEESDSVKTMMSKFLHQGKWTGQKITTTILPNGSKRIESDLFRENDWFKFFDYVESTSRSRTDNAEIEIISTKGKQYDAMRSSNEVVAHIKSELHVEVFYDKKGMITEIIITDINNIHNAIRTFRPKRIKMCIT